MRGSEAELAWHCHMAAETLLANRFLLVGKRAGVGGDMSWGRGMDDSLPWVLGAAGCALPLSCPLARAVHHL